MKLHNIDMHQPIPLWIPIGMIAVAFSGLVWLTWSICHAS